MAPLEPQGKGGAGPCLPPRPREDAGGGRAQPWDAVRRARGRDGKARRWPRRRNGEPWRPAGHGRRRCRRRQVAAHPRVRRRPPRKHARVVRGRCLPYGDGITFWPLAEIVREAAEITNEDSPRVATRRIDRLLERAAVEDREAVVERVAAAINLNAAQFPVAELMWGARRFLEALAAERPLVMIVDDLHWAEPTFLDFLDHLIESVEGASILVLGTARHELAERHADWSTAHDADAGQARAAERSGRRDRSSRSCSATLEPIGPRPDRAGGRGQPAVRRADRVDAHGDRRHRARRARAGSPRLAPASSRSRRRSRPWWPPASTPSSPRSGPSSIPASVIGLTFALDAVDGARRRARFERASASDLDVLAAQAARAPPAARRRSSTGSATRSFATPPTAAS